MLMEDWLHKKAEENAHNEILAFLLIILGTNLLTAGLLVTIIVSGEQELWLFSIYRQLQTATTSLGPILTITGFIISSAGFILIIHYDRKRSWYIKELEKSAAPRKGRTASKSISEILEEYTGKRKRE